MADETDTLEVGGRRVKKLLHGLGLMLFLFLRGFALWVLIPFASLAWLVVHSWAQKVTLRQAICWYDSNVNLFLLKGPLRPLLQLESFPGFVRISQMSVIKPYKISTFDLV